MDVLNRGKEAHFSYKVTPVGAVGDSLLQMIEKVGGNLIRVSATPNGEIDISSYEFRIADTEGKFIAEQSLKACAMELTTLTNIFEKWEPPVDVSISPTFVEQ